MKTLFRNVNKAGVIMILFAAGLIVTQSAFKSNTTLAPNFYYDTVSASWKALDPATVEGHAPGNYQCNSSLTLKCTAETVTFTPTNPEGIPGGIVRDGEFEIQ